MGFWQGRFLVARDIGTPEGLDVANVGFGVQWWFEVQWPFGWIAVPLWLPFALIAIPTVYFWFTDRRLPRPGQCTQCGYNLQGLTSKRCPECGDVIESHPINGKVASYNEQDI